MLRSYWNNYRYYYHFDRFYLNALLELAILYLNEPLLITVRLPAKVEVVSKTGQFK